MNSSIATTRYLTGVLLAAAILVSGFTVLAMRAHADVNTGNPTVSAVVAIPTDTAATITWSSDQAGSTQVMYGTTTTYSASSTLDNTQVNNHTATLLGLTPNTMYHFEVVTASTTTGLQGTSSDMTFTTGSTTIPVASTTPVLTTVLASPSINGAVITWNSNIAANSQVLYGLTNTYGSTSTLDTNNVTSHTVTLSGLAPSTAYHFQVWSTGTGTMSATSTDMTFTTLTASTTTGTSTGDMITFLQTQITNLTSRVSTLESEVAALIAGGGTGGGGTTTPPVSTGGTTIDTNGSFITAGGPMDLSGRNFGHEENVNVTVNGATVAVAHADGGGNFSTGSFNAPATPGTYTFVFTGQTSGFTNSTSLVVH
jgi:hypothetical protein